MRGIRATPKRLSPGEARLPEGIGFLWPAYQVARAASLGHALNFRLSELLHNCYSSYVTREIAPVNPFWLFLPEKVELSGSDNTFFSHKAFK